MECVYATVRHEGASQTVRLVIAHFAAGILCAATSLGAQSPAIGKSAYPDDPIRAFAETSPLPQYPEGSIRAREIGVAVVFITLDAGRRLQKVDVLEAPSEAIKSSVVHALRQWTFRHASKDPAGSNLERATLSGTVTFYFYEMDGRYVVSSPKDTPPAAVLKSRRSK